MSLHFILIIRINHSKLNGYYFYILNLWSIISGHEISIRGKSPEDTHSTKIKITHSFFSTSSSSQNYAVWYAKADTAPNWTTKNPHELFRRDLKYDWVVYWGLRSRQRRAQRAQLHPTIAILPPIALPYCKHQHTRR